MRHIAIWGASSGLGAAMSDYYFEHGFNVIAIARNPTKNAKLVENQITSITCDATNAIQVQQAVSLLPENTINISTMGSFNSNNPVDYIGHRYLIDALENSTSRRLFLITSLGCGDSWKYLSARAKIGFGSAVREKTLAEAWLQSSSLKFTILRPGGLKDGEVTNLGEISQDKEVHGVITRREVARLSHELLLKTESVGQIYQCIDPTLSY